MRIGRIEFEGEPRYAVLDGEICDLVDGDLFGAWRPAGRTVPMSQTRLLAPMSPRQIVAVGLNYRRHAAEGGRPIPEAPVLFLKGVNAVIGPGEPIVLPNMAPDEVDYEAELVVVIGRRAKNVPEDEADDYVLGYTCGNDVSARDCQMRLDQQWARAKSFDTFAPLGPWIETELDPEQVRVRTDLNGERMQDSDTADMVFSCRELVSYVSRCMTLVPGSVLMTGTPGGVGFARTPQVFLRDGDTVTVEVDGIGRLTNPVRREA